MRICIQCNSTMHKISSLTSGNAHFETWQCDKCLHREKFCAGLE